MKAYRTLLEGDSEITMLTQWRRIKDKYQGHTLHEALEPIDRLTAFEDHIRALERAEVEKQRTQKEQDRKSARQYRDEFRVCASCIVHRASCIVHRASCIVHRASCLVPRASYRSELNRACLLQRMRCVCFTAERNGMISRKQFSIRLFT
jgi:hypothetical protein